MTGMATPPREGDRAAEIDALRAQLVVLEASIEGLRRELLVEKRRTRGGQEIRLAEMSSRLTAIESSRAYRLSKLYYMIYSIPLIGAVLRMLRATVGRAISVVKGKA